MKSTKKLEDLIELVKTLRGPGGCPWDREQTLADLKTYLIGEAYELLEAIDQNSPDHIAEEAGDLLFIILFVVDFFREKKTFTIHEVIGAVVDKMVRRHPHVFAHAAPKTSREVKSDWRYLKEQEGKPPCGASVLDGVPGFLPALVQAQLLTHRASQAGFEWENTDRVIAKIEEELKELRERVRRNEPGGTADELGDVLLSVVNLGRHLQLDAEQVLHNANKKFTKRFHFVEEALRQASQDMAATSLEELVVHWEKAKEEYP